MKTLDFNLKYPFSSKRSSYFGLIEEYQKEWIEYYLWMPEKMKIAYKTSKIITLAGIIYPDADEKGILAIARWLLLGFAFDDYYDGRSKDEFHSIRIKAVEVLNGKPANPNPKTPEDIFLSEFANVRDMFKEVASPFWVKRFIANQELWIEGMEEETEYNEYEDVLIYPTYDKYLSIREKISGCLILSDFVEVAAGFKMPENIYKSDYIQKLRHHITFSIMWSNDIYGAARELERNEVMNLVLVIKNEYKCSLDEAYERAAQLHNNGINEFIKLTGNVPDFGEYNQDVQNYIKHAKLLLQGQKEWHENSDRYQEQEA